MAENNMIKIVSWNVNGILIIKEFPVGDAMQPGTELGGAAPAGHFLEGGQEGFLCKVIGSCVIVHHQAPHIVAYGSLVTLNQQRKRLVVSGESHPGSQRLIGNHLVFNPC